jgi:hypothetical protein
LKKFRSTNTRDASHLLLGDTWRDADVDDGEMCSS